MSPFSENASAFRPVQIGSPRAVGIGSSAPSGPRRAGLRGARGKRLRESEADLAWICTGRSLAATAQGISSRAAMENRASTDLQRRITYIKALDVSHTDEGASE
jgi:hypothetical protein